MKTKFCLSVPTPKASFIPAQGNALGSLVEGDVRALKARFIRPPAYLARQNALPRAGVCQAFGLRISDFGWPVRLGHSSFVIRHSSFTRRAFTLLELIVVIAIIGIIAAIALPTLNAYRPNLLAVASRQLLDDLSWARQRAISDHTTVYVVFIPACVGNLASTPPANLPAAEIQHLLQGQFTSYAFYVKRQLGDQPGTPTVRYLTGWKTLPVGTMIAPQKFGGPGIYTGGLPTAVAVGGTNVCWAFDTGGGNVKWNPDLNPQPVPDSVYFPYVAFDYHGGLVQRLSQQQDGVSWHTDNIKGHCCIPLTKGIINLPKDAAGLLTWAPPAVNENPPGAWSDPNLHTYVVIDGPTGRAHVEHALVQ